MSTLIEIEAAILGLPPLEKEKLVDWVDEQRGDWLPLSDATLSEIRRRRDELIQNPALAQPMDSQFFARLRRRLADVRATKSSAR